MRLVDFGAFIQLEEGVEGLAHISELSDKRVRTAGDAVKVGEVVKARVKGVDPQARRISLSLKGASAVAAEPAAVAETRKPPKRKKPLRGGLE
jgi:ribosomal protein S1